MAFIPSYKSFYSWTTPSFLVPQIMKWFTAFFNFIFPFFYRRRKKTLPVFILVLSRLDERKNVSSLLLSSLFNLTFRMKTEKISLFHIELSKTLNPDVWCCTSSKHWIDVDWDCVSGCKPRCFLKQQACASNLEWGWRWHCSNTCNDPSVSVMFAE